jgi:hypothetical protein
MAMFASTAGGCWWSAAVLPRIEGEPIKFWPFGVILQEMIWMSDEIQAFFAGKKGFRDASPKAC